MQHLINQALSKGYRVFTPVNPSTYFYIVQGDSIGYCQSSRGIDKFSTVHKPSQQNGTGFQVHTMEETLMIAPLWARGTVSKYKNIDDFLAKHWQKLIEVK